MNMGGKPLQRFLVTVEYACMDTDNYYQHHDDNDNSHVGRFFLHACTRFAFTLCSRLSKRSRISLLSGGLYSLPRHT